MSLAEQPVNNGVDSLFGLSDAFRDAEHFNSDERRVEAAFMLAVALEDPSVASAYEQIQTSPIGAKEAYVADNLARNFTFSAELVKHFAVLIDSRTVLEVEKAAVEANVAIANLNTAYAQLDKRLSPPGSGPLPPNLAKRAAVFRNTPLPAMAPTPNK